jgi:putative membrane protein
MIYLYLKAIHLIFVVTWFAGMFYLVRLLIYDREACEKDEVERIILQRQFSIMYRRLYWAITLPSAIITLILGIILVSGYSAIPTWLKLKLFFVSILYLYQISLHILVKWHQKGKYKYTSQQLRLWNELPTIILVAVSMLVIVRSEMSFIYGLLGIIVFTFLVYSAIRIYKAIRKNN